MSMLFLPALMQLATDAKAQQTKICLFLPIPALACLFWPTACFLDHMIAEVF